MEQLTLILLFNFMFVNIYAHVAFSFPPARKVDLDFLTNKNIQLPCGMPKGWTRTLIPTGMFMNFTWKMAYPHQGGYRIELLDRDYRWLANLTEAPQGQEFVIGNPTAQWHLVKTPDKFCSHCIIRLVRQAKEFGETTEYNTCADVDIIDRKQFRNRCYGHGIPYGSLCFCYRGYSGPLCQYKEECDSDIDCNSRGRCIHIGGTNYPSRQCFCAPGFHGEKCLLANAAVLPTHSNFNVAVYHQRKMSDRFTLYYRVVRPIISDNPEIEFALEIVGTTFGALGMRPNYFNETCKLWPPIDEYVPPIIPSESTFSTVPIGNDNGLGINDFYFDSTSMPSHSAVRSEPKTRTFVINLNFGNNVYSSAKIPQQRIIRPSKYGPLMGQFSAMDCTDMTIGAAKGMYSRIRDYYSRDFATPQLDENWGGWDDITSATGWEINGKTTLIFRRNMKSVDLTDHHISGEMHVIWARGQEPGEYIHAAPSGLEIPEYTPSDRNFYTPDELKYHGHGMQRGSDVIDFSN